MPKVQSAKGVKKRLSRKSSGVKAIKRKRNALNPNKSKNLNPGIHPETGKTFLVCRKDTHGTIHEVSRWQTRAGAKKAARPCIDNGKKGKDQIVTRSGDLIFVHNPNLENSPITKKIQDAEVKKKSNWEAKQAQERNALLKEELIKAFGKKAGMKEYDSQKEDTKFVKVQYFSHALKEEFG